MLWLLSVTTVAAATGPGAPRARPNLTHEEARAVIAKSLERRTANVGRPFVKVRKIGASLLTRRAYFQRAGHLSHVDDDDAIQNDAPAANVDVNPFLALRQVGLSIEAPDQQTFGRYHAPRSPRGPPVSA